MSSQLSEISTPGQTDVIELIINGNLIGRRNCDALAADPKVRARSVSDG